MHKIITNIFINQINKVLAKNYNNAKQNLIDVAGEDLETISNVLKDMSKLISDVAKSNIKLIGEKAKYELAKANYDAFKDYYPDFIGVQKCTSYNFLTRIELVL